MNPDLESRANPVDSSERGELDSMLRGRKIQRTQPRDKAPIGQGIVARVSKLHESLTQP